MNTQLIRRAVVLFPRTEYTDAAAVRHARRSWLKSVNYLRYGTSRGWLVDQPVARKACSAT
jgi:hypothetical protein